MANINEVLAKAVELSWQIDSLLRLSTYKQYDDLSGLEINCEDAEQVFLLDELRVVMDKLADAKDKISYLTRPIKETSRLHKNESGKYETRCGHYYSCGYGIEALVSDDYREVPYWSRTRVEHADGDYYLVGHRGVPLDGLTVRVREVQQYGM